MADNVNGTLKLTVLSPERRLLDSVEVRSVTLPGSEGQIQVLPGHAAMIGSIMTGPFFFETTDGRQDAGAFSTGFFEVVNDVVSVMGETVELRKEINLERARTAQQKAEQALGGADLDEHAFKKYQLKLQRAIIRQQVASHEHS